MVEFDERSLAAMRALLTADVRSVTCPGCSQSTECLPMFAVWIERKSRVELFDGGPWCDNLQAAEIFPELAGHATATYASLAELQTSLRSRCIDWLLAIQKAMELDHGGDGEREWFKNHYSRLGAEIYVAAHLGHEGLLGDSVAFVVEADPTEARAAIDAEVGRLQARACLEMCWLWAGSAFPSKRLQHCIDEIAYPDAVSPAAPRCFQSAVEKLLDQELRMSLQNALEVTLASLCVCARLSNERARPYTLAMFNLEILATVVGGALPLNAHACRLDPERLKVTVDASALTELISHKRGTLTADLIETARRMGHPDAAKHLVTTGIPEWFSKLRRPGNLGHIIVHRDGEVLAAQDITAENALSPFEGLAEQLGSKVTSGEPPRDIFLSYSGHDRIKANIIARCLQSHGLTVFMDHHTAAGDLWMRKLKDQLHSSRLVLVLWSRNSLQSEWVLKEAEIALSRNVLVHALIAPVSVPRQFDHILASHLEGCADDEKGPELARMARELCARLEHVPSLTPTECTGAWQQQYERTDVAEFVLDWCNANVWNSLAKATSESIAPVERPYARLKAALAPIGDNEIHDLLQRFDPARVYLLVCVESLAKEGLAAPLVTIPRVGVTRSEEQVVFRCELVQVWRAPFVAAIRESTGGVAVRGEHLAAVGADALSTPKGVVIEVSPLAENPRAIGSIVVRLASLSLLRPTRGASGQLERT